MVEIQNDVARSTIVVRMSGTIGVDEMREFAERYRVATDQYGGRQHLVLADMRGLKPSSPTVAEIFQEAIAYARCHGVACCAHLSDSTIARLQAARLAFEASGGDDVTIDAVSLDEAERVLERLRASLGTATP